MLVLFEAHIVITEPDRTFREKLLRNIVPFRQLDVVGGTVNWYCSGVLATKTYKQKKRVCDAIAIALVDLVEEHTLVGVESIEFEKIDPEYAFQESSN